MANKVTFEHKFVSFFKVWLPTKILNFIRSNGQKSYLELVLKAAPEWILALYRSDLSLEFIDGKIVLYLAYDLFPTVNCTVVAID